MTDATVFLRGTVLAFSIAAPVGPIGLLCIRRTLLSRPAVGLATGLGAGGSGVMITGFGVFAVLSTLGGRAGGVRTP
ncbi:MAG: hypothetical protein ACRENS_04745 [Candidatus Eiseniibacteriota bacterium]